MTRTRHVPLLCFLLLAGCGGVPTLPCNTPTDLSGDDEAEFRWGMTRPGAIAGAVASVPGRSVYSALGGFECPPDQCRFKSVREVRYVVTGTDSTFSLVSSIFNFDARYVGEADYTWFGLGSQCTASRVENPREGVEALAPCPGAALIITAAANARTGVGTQVGGTVLCGPAPGTPAPLTAVEIRYPDGVVRRAITNATGTFVDRRNDYDGGGHGHRGRHWQRRPPGHGDDAHQRRRAVTPGTRSS